MAPEAQRDPPQNSSPRMDHQIIYLETLPQRNSSPHIGYQPDNHRALEFQTSLRNPEDWHNSDGHHDQLQLPSNQLPQPFDGDPKFRDSSGPLFSMYSEIAEEEDNKMVEHWQKDADGILIFVCPSVVIHSLTYLNRHTIDRLFSVAVAVLLVMSVQDLRPNPQVTSAFYLENIYQILADPNGTTIARLPPLSPPRECIVWVNSLWFLSFVVSLTCGLMATLLRQWSHRYVTSTQPRGSPEKRARMRALFANGVDKMHVPWTVEALPVLLHLSLFLFFSGLVIFLFNINHTVFASVIWWIGLASTMYGWVTLMPIFRHDSPYYAPLSPTAWSLYTSSQHILFKCLASIAWQIKSYRLYFVFRDLRNRYGAWMSVGIGKEAEELATKRSSELDFQIFDWTMGALVDDDALETYFEAIPGFANSKLTNVVQHPKDNFTHYDRFWEVSCGLLGRSLSINPAIEAVKARRFANCMNAMNAMPCPYHVSELIYRIIDDHLDQEPLSSEMGHTLAPLFANNRHISEYAKSLVCKILMRMRDRDDRWVALAIDCFGEFGVSEDQLREHISNSYSNATVFLDILISVANQFHLRGSNRSNIHLLKTLSKLDIHRDDVDIVTQHRFCSLWNEMVRTTKYEAGHFEVLCLIRRLYTILHRGTRVALTAFDAPTPGDDLNLADHTYPLCDIPDHQYDPHPDAHSLIIRPPSSLSVQQRPDNSMDRSSPIPSVITVSHPLQSGAY